MTLAAWRVISGSCISARPDDPLTHYVVVRRDLPLGILAAQVVHAAGASSPGGLPEETHAVVLAARDEADLLRIAERLRGAGAGPRVIHETDPPWNGAAMALGLAPAPRSRWRRLLSDIPLLREKEVVTRAA